MISPYKGEARETFERVHTLNAYTVGKLYKSPNNKIYYINSRGFLHFYTVEKGLFMDKKVFFIVDNLLTAANMIKETDRFLYYRREDIEKNIIRMMTIAEENTANE